MPTRLLVPIALLAAGTLPGCVAAAIPVLAGGALISNTGGNKGTSTPGEIRTPVQAFATPAVQAIQPPPPLRAGPAAPAVPLAALQLTKFDPAFAAFAAYANTAATAEQAETPPMSALLRDPVALDGQRNPCQPGRQLAVMIDLDPAGQRFTPPASPPSLPEHAAALGAIREAGITIAWISDSPVTQTGAIRTALEQSGLDPRGMDVLVLAGSPDDRKQVLREALATHSCILAIAGDERPDFDERFRYLRNPAAGAGLEVLIGQAWFLVRNIFPSSFSSTGPSNP